MKKRVLTSLAGLGLLLSFQAFAQGGMQVCDGRYALCSSALCTPSGKNADGEDVAACVCEPPLEGLNIGESSCQQRASALTSTFSLWDLTQTATKPAKSVLVCEGDNANAWTYCLDAPCEVIDGKTICTCPIVASSDYYTFGGNCDTENACDKLWSAATLPALLGGYGELWPFEADIPKLQYCP